METGTGTLIELKLQTRWGNNAGVVQAIDKVDLPTNSEKSDSKDSCG